MTDEEVGLTEEETGMSEEEAHLTEEEAKQMDGLMEERVGLIGKVIGLLEMNIVVEREGRLEKYWEDGQTELPDKDHCEEVFICRQKTTTQHSH